MDVVNGITRLRAKVLLHAWSYNFYDTTLSTEKTATSYDKHIYVEAIDLDCSILTILSLFI